MADLDMDNRDPNELNCHIKLRFYTPVNPWAIVLLPLINDTIQVNFEDVLGEPEGVRSIDCVWRNSYACFNCGKNCMYKLLTTLCGICIALGWGCEFACSAFQHVWCLTPCMREFSIACGFLQKCFGTVLNCCLTPICEACGMCLSNIHVHNK